MSHPDRLPSSASTYSSLTTNVSEKAGNHHLHFMMAPSGYVKLPSYEILDQEKGQLAADDVAAPHAEEAPTRQRRRRCIRFLAAFMMFMFVAHAIHLFPAGCKSITAVGSTSYEVSTLFPYEVSISKFDADSFEVNPADIGSIDVSVKGDVLSKIHARTSESDNILFVLKAFSRKPGVEANVTVSHEVKDGELRVAVEAPECKKKPKDGKDKDGGKKKPKDGKDKDDDKPDDDDKSGDDKDDSESLEGLENGDILEVEKRRRRDGCKPNEDVIVEVTMYLPQSKIKEGTNVKVKAAKSSFTSDDLTNLQLGTVDVNFDAGAVSSKGIKAKALFLYVGNGGINGIYTEYTSFSAEIQNGGINLESLKSNQNAPSNVRLVAKTGGIVVNKIEFSQNYVNAVDANVHSGGVKIFARDNFSGDFTVQSKIGSFKVWADTSGLEIENNVRSPTGGYVSGTFRSKDSLQNGRINVSVDHGSSELKFTSNG